MELYLDSVKYEEIEEANNLGFLAGLTTTPTFMHREGITDIDAEIMKLSRIVPILQIEALGNNADEIVGEALRLLSMGLDKEKTVFKIPISLEGAKACKALRNRGIMVNLHLIYSLQQAYMALCAGANYICPLIGRLQDQGHDALLLIEQCVKAAEKYNYASKIMFSSVRHPEHVRNALNIGVHACTIPWKVMKQLTDNHLTNIGTQQFVEHTKLMTTKAGDIVRRENTGLNYNASVLEALMLMTKSKLGAIIVMDDNNKIYRMFTDGDLRRMLNVAGEEVLNKKLSELEPNNPLTIDVNTGLLEIVNLMKEKKVDNIVVTENGEFLGIIDIQDIL